MKIGIGNDHAAPEMKFRVKEYLEGLGYEVVNFGTDTDDRVDYPDIAEKVCDAIVNGEVEKGVLICGTGLGMSIAANKIDGIRAACCSEPFSAALAVEHNNANVICFGARVIDFDKAREILDAYFGAEFQGGRHAVRVDKIMALENR